MSFSSSTPDSKWDETTDTCHVEVRTCTARSNIVDYRALSITLSQLIIGDPEVELKADTIFDYFIKIEARKDDIHADRWRTDVERRDLTAEKCD